RGGRTGRSRRRDRQRRLSRHRPADPLVADHHQPASLTQLALSGEVSSRRAEWVCSGCRCGRGVELRLIPPAGPSAPTHTPGSWPDEPDPRETAPEPAVLSRLCGATSQPTSSSYSAAFSVDT